MDQEFRIGDKVRIKAILKFKYVGDEKVIERTEIKPVLGIVNGWAVRRTGKKTKEINTDGTWNLDSKIEDHHKVWIVTRTNKLQKYNIPLICFVEDLELVSRYQ